MDFLRGDKSPSSEALLPVVTREKTASETESTDNRQRPVSANKMAYARRTLVVLFLCMLVLLGVASGSGMPCHKAATNQQQEAVKASESSSFSTMLKSASPASLHELLHRFLPDRFKDGVFPSDHQAMEVVHQADPALATSIVQLAKRQDSNSTTSSDSETPTPTETETSEPPTETTTSTTTPPTSSSTSDEPTSSSSEPPVSSSSSTPSSTSSSSSLPGTSSSSSETTSSSSSSETTSSSSSSETTSSSTSSSSSEPGTSSSSSSLSSSSSSSSSSSPSQTSSSSSASPTMSPSSIPGETTLTTSTVTPTTTTPPPTTSKEITTTYTTTSPDGGVVTVTAITYVPAGPNETPAPATTQSPPTLQNFAIRGRSSGSVLTGAVGLAMVLLMV